MPPARRAIIHAAWLLAAIPAVTGIGYAQGRPAGVAVEIIETRSLAETVPVFADVVTVRDGVVAARVAGTVSSVSVLEGVTVEAGALLAVLDTELAEIEFRQAEARLAEAKAGIDVARARSERLELALARIERLRSTAAFSQGRFEEAQGEVFQARGQVAEAEARVLNAEAALAEVRYRIDQAELRAPFAGTVLDVSVNPGEFITSGAPVVRLLDTSTLEVEARVPSKYVDTLEPGVRVSAVTENGTELSLAVRAVLPVEDPSTRTRPVRFTSANGALAGKAVGQSVTVEVPTSPPRDVLAVPKDALVQAQGGWMVFVDENGSAQPRNVQIGAALGTWFEVTDGLAKGDRVVVRGNERLRPGQPIQASVLGE